LSKEGEEKNGKKKKNKRRHLMTGEKHTKPPLLRVHRKDVHMRITRRMIGRTPKTLPSNLNLGGKKNPKLRSAKKGETNGIIV